jgi:SAM-dependent methyltransferase
MDRHEYESLYKLEKNYWWFIGQRFLLTRLLRGKYGGRADLDLLDVGCGTGWTMKVLSQFGSVSGADVADDAIEFCSFRGLNDVTKTNVMDLSFSSDSFDVVTALGVFYHKEVCDDTLGFQEIHRVLKPGGRFLIMDCASKSLFGKHDLAFHGIRRYPRRGLKKKLRDVGFIIERISYFNMLFFPLVYLKRKLELLVNAPIRSDIDTELPVGVNWLLKKIYKMELRGLKYVDYPFGVNIFAVVRKR